MQEDDEEGDAVDMTQREAEEDDGGKVHEIKFDEYGIMDDGVDESTEEQLAKLKSAGGKCAKRSSDGMPGWDTGKEPNVWVGATNTQIF